LRLLSLSSANTDLAEQNDASKRTARAANLKGPDDLQFCAFTRATCLPGIYWLTFFGPELVSFFGRDRLLALGVHQVLDCGASGIGILLQSSPIAGTAVGEGEVSLSPADANVLLRRMRPATRIFAPP
jgi:hypothetical protein